MCAKLLFFRTFTTKTRYKMKNQFNFLLCIASLAILLSGCQSHFISDATTRKAVDEAFEARRAHFTHGDVFAIFDEELSAQERGAMKFLYSSMSIGTSSHHALEPIIPRRIWQIHLRE